MRYSKMLIPTVKQIPADAEIKSHQLMILFYFMNQLIIEIIVMPGGMNVPAKKEELIQFSLRAVMLL